MLRLFRKMIGKSKTDINKFIRKAALNQDPIFDVYKKLCKNYGKMDYVDFEWRYYQFYHGNRDLTIEKSPNNSSPVAFSDLPMDVLETILNNFPLVNRLTLRKVSLSLRNLVDSAEVYCDKIAFFFGDSYSKMKMESRPVRYSKTNDAVSTVDYKWEIKTWKDNRSFQEVMVSDASTFLKNPKLKIGVISIAVNSIEAVSEFVHLLKSLSFQLNVQKAAFCTNYVRSGLCMWRRRTTGKEYVLPILPFLKPTTLEQIEIEIGDMEKEHINKIMETEQWKTATKFSCSHCDQLECLLHFKTMYIRGFKFTEENLIMVRDILLTSTHLESCTLKDEWTDPTNDERRFKSVMCQSPAYNPTNLQFSIPNSSDYFQLSIEIVQITLTYSDYRNITLTIEKVLGES